MGTPSQSSPLDLDQFEGFTPELVRHAARAIEDGPFWSTGDMASTAATRDLVLAAPALLAECRRQRDELRWLADSEAALIRRRTEQDAELARQREEIARLRGALEHAIGGMEHHPTCGIRRRKSPGCSCRLAAARAALGEAE